MLRREMFGQYWKIENPIPECLVSYNRYSLLRIPTGKKAASILPPKTLESSLRSISYGDWSRKVV
jgi:hypothetical protein